MCAAMAPTMLLRIQLYAYLVSPAPQPTFIPWQRRWQPILPIRDLCWRSIIAVMAKCLRLGGCKPPEAVFPYGVDERTSISRGRIRLRDRVSARQAPLQHQACTP